VETGERMPQGVERGPLGASFLSNARQQLCGEVPKTENDTSRHAQRRDRSGSSNSVAIPARSTLDLLIGRA
jgi:hypothetical protein